MLVEGEVRVRWSDLTVVKKAIQRAAAEGITGLRPRFDLFDEAQAAWVHKTAELIVLKRGYGLLAKVQTVTRPFRPHLYRALARSSEARPLPALSSHLTAHDPGSASRGTNEGLSNSHGRDGLRRGLKRARDVSTVTTPTKRVATHSTTRNNDMVRRTTAVGAVRAHQVKPTASAVVEPHINSNPARTSTEGPASDVIVLSDDDDGDDAYDDILPNPLAFLWE